MFPLLSSFILPDEWESPPVHTFRTSKQIKNPCPGSGEWCNKSVGLVIFALSTAVHRHKLPATKTKTTRPINRRRGGTLPPVRIACLATACRHHPRPRIIPHRKQKKVFALLGMVLAHTPLDMSPSHPTTPFYSKMSLGQPPPWSPRWLLRPRPC